MILGLGQFASKLLVYVMMRFYTGMLGTDGYGAVGNIVDVSVLLMNLVTVGIGESVIRFGLDGKYDKKQVFSVGLTVTLIGLVLFIPLVPVVGLVDFLSEYSVLIYIYVFSGSVKSCCGLFVRSSGKVTLYAVDGILTTVFNIIFNLIFLLGFNMGVAGYVLSVVLADCCSVIFLVIKGRLGNYFVISGIDKKLRRAMLRFSLPLVPTAIMWWVTNVSDSFLITAMLGVSENGVYKAAYKLPNVIALVSGIFSQAWNMSAVKEKNSRGIARFYTNVFNILQSVVYICAGGMLLFIKPALMIMTSGDGFGTAYKYSPLLVLAVVFTCFSTFVGSVYLAAKNSVGSLLTSSAGAIVNVVLNIILIPVWGLNGAAFATFISYVLIFAIRTAHTRGTVRLDIMPVKMCANMIVLSAMGLAVMRMIPGVYFYAVLSVLFVLILAMNLPILIYVMKKRGAA